MGTKRVITTMTISKEKTWFRWQNRRSRKRMLNNKWKKWDRSRDQITIRFWERSLAGIKKCKATAFRQLSNKLDWTHFRKMILKASWRNEMTHFSQNQAINKFTKVTTLRLTSWLLALKTTTRTNVTASRFPVCRKNLGLTNLEAWLISTYQAMVNDLWVLLDWKRRSKSWSSGGTSTIITNRKTQSHVWL